MFAAVILKVYEISRIHFRKYAPSISETVCLLNDIFFKLYIYIQALSTG